MDFFFDLLIENGEDIIPIEIKAGATINNDFFKGLRFFQTKLNNSTVKSQLVYGGDENQNRTDTSIWNAMSIVQMMNEINLF